MLYFGESACLLVTHSIEVLLKRLQTFHDSPVDPTMEAQMSHIVSGIVPAFLVDESSR